MLLKDGLSKRFDDPKSENSRCHLDSPLRAHFLDAITSVDSDAVLASQLINCALSGPLWRLATAGSQHPELSVSASVAFTPASTVQVSLVVNLGAF